MSDTGASGGPSDLARHRDPDDRQVARAGEASVRRRSRPILPTVLHEAEPQRVPGHAAAAWTRSGALTPLHYTTVQRTLLGRLPTLMAIFRAENLAPANAQLPVYSMRLTDRGGAPVRMAPRLTEDALYLDANDVAGLAHGTVPADITSILWRLAGI